MLQLKLRKTSVIYSALDSPYGADGVYTPSNMILSPYFSVSGYLYNFYYDYSGMYSFAGNTFCRPHQFGIYWSYIFIFIFWIIIWFFSFLFLRKLFVFGVTKLVNFIKQRRSAVRGTMHDDMMMVPFLESDDVITKRKKSIQII